MKPKTSIAELDSSKPTARPGSRLTDTQVALIEPELKALEVERGAIAPEDVVERARDPANPLHRHFDWDDEAAAHAQRLSVARTLIRSVVYRVKFIGDDINSYTPAFVSVQTNMAPSDDEDESVGGRGYVGLQRVLDSAQLSAQMIQSAKRDMESWIRRYRTVAALAAPVRLAQEVLEKLKAG